MTTRKLLGSACLLMLGMYGVAQAQDTGPPAAGDYLKTFNSRSGTYSYFSGTAASPEYMAFNASPAIGALAAGTLTAGAYVGVAPTTQYIALLENPAFAAFDPPTAGVPCILLPNDPTQSCLSDILMYVDNSPAGPPNVAMFSDEHGLFLDPTLGAILGLIAPGHILMETGLEQDVSSLILSAGAPLAPNTVLVFSDVPVPAAAWLFGSALGLLGLRRRMS